MSVETKSIKAAINEMRDKSAKKNFNQSVELVIGLRDVDVKKPEGKIQERMELPHPIGKKINICVFASGDMALRAKRGGADLVLEGTEIESLANDKKRQRQIAKSMDAFIAAAPLMPVVGRVFGAVLGPRNKMPIPVAPTANIEGEIERERRIILVRTRNQPIVQCRVGTEGMPDDEISENVQAVLTGIRGKLKRGAKNIDSVQIKMTMGPSVKVSV